MDWQKCFRINLEKHEYIKNFKLGYIRLFDY